MIAELRLKRNLTAAQNRLLQLADDREASARAIEWLDERIDRTKRQITDIQKEITALQTGNTGDKQT